MVNLPILYLDFRLGQCFPQRAVSFNLNKNSSCGGLQPLANKNSGGKQIFGGKNSGQKKKF